MIELLQRGMRDLTPIQRPYLLCLNIESYRDSKGQRYLNALWQKDLKFHLQYIQDLRLACPCRHGTPPPDAVCVSQDPAFTKLQFIDLPTADSWIDAFVKLPVTIFVLWQAVRKATWIHTCIVGWVIPYGWLITPLRLMYPQKLLFIVVESAPWRRLPSVSAISKPMVKRLKSSLFGRLGEVLGETLGRWCVNRADLAVFTQADYKASLLTRYPERGHVINASWIDAEVILGKTAAERLWQEKTAEVERLKVIFVGRLTLSKGVHVLLDVAEQLNQAAVPADITIVGQGEERDYCRERGLALQGSVKVQFLEAVPYDHRFWELLQAQHVIVVPSLSDEQPRIVYDAFAQALPVIASSTPGLRACVQHQHSGILVEPNDVEALAALLQWSLQNLSELQRMGLAARQTALGLTHWMMHQQRWQLLAAQESA